MSEPRFTKGPWRLGADLLSVHLAWRDEGGSISAETLHRNGFAKRIATIGKEGDWRGIEQFVADGRLITTAPELYEALQAVDRIALEQRCERGTPWDLACTTIAEKLLEHVAPILASARGDHE